MKHMRRLIHEKFIMRYETLTIRKNLFSSNITSLSRVLYFNPLLLIMVHYKKKVFRQSAMESYSS